VSEIVLAVAIGVCGESVEVKASVFNPVNV